jgi:signal transduction histidine kinase
MKAKLEGMVHDLNNVFTTMLDTADLLESDPEYAAIAGVLQRNVARGRRILESFAESGAETVELRPLLAGAIEFARDFLKVEGIEVDFRTDVAEGLAVTGSSIAWERVFFNLLINAGQAIGGRGVVEIAGRQDGDNVEIVVADDGPGIPADVLPRIFQSGFTTNPRRSGVGLQIVESIVRESGGRIAASNRPGARGAAFRISAPAVAAAAPAKRV